MEWPLLRPDTKMTLGNKTPLAPLLYSMDITPDQNFGIGTVLIKTTEMGKLLEPIQQCKHSMKMCFKVLILIMHLNRRKNEIRTLTSKRNEMVSGKISIPEPDQAVSNITVKEGVYAIQFTTNQGKYVFFHVHMELFRLNSNTFH